MLQIISGKFFTGGKLREEESDAILYTNYSWVVPIKTSVAELRPVDTYDSRVAAYVLRYTNRYEAEPTTGHKQAVLYLPNAEQAVEQFCLLASYYFHSFFHVDRSYVESLCRTNADHSFDRTIPRAFVPRFFDLGKRGEHTEITGFVQFVDRVLMIPRKQYRLFMSCLAGFFEALETIGKNFDVAYSMMVYTLEALSKTVAQPTPVWDDYDPNVRTRLDKQLSSLDATTAARIRMVLLDNPHLKLKKRFISFIFAHLKDTYFTMEAEGLNSPLAKSEMDRALTNLYAARSGYVHELKQVQEQIRLRGIGTEGDVFHWMNEPHFTFAGLVRLTHHILASFVDKQPLAEKEEYPGWRDELPGIVHLQLAPEYWVARAEDFEAVEAKKRFSGFVHHYVANLAETPNRLLDLRGLMVRIEEVMPCAKSKDRIPMLALYWFFNEIIPEAHRRPGWESYLSRWHSDVDECCVELMVAHILLGRELPWSVEKLVAAFALYQRSRHKPSSTYMPKRIDVAIMAEIANHFIDDGNVDDYDDWINRSILDAAGLKTVQCYLFERQKKRQKIDVNHLLGGDSIATTENVASDLD